MKKEDFYNEYEKPAPAGSSGFFFRMVLGVVLGCMAWWFVVNSGFNQRTANELQEITPAVVPSPAPAVNNIIVMVPTSTPTPLDVQGTIEAYTQPTVMALYDLNQQLYATLEPLPLILAEATKTSDQLVNVHAKIADVAYSQRVTSYASATLGMALIVGMLVLLFKPPHQIVTPPHTLPPPSFPPIRDIAPPRPRPAALVPVPDVELVQNSSAQFRTVLNLELHDVLSLLPLEGNEEPPPELRELWRELHRKGMTKEAICRAFYGSKGSNYRWVKAAFDEAPIVG